MAEPTPLSGTQYTVQAGAYEATVASVGASLRTLRFAGRDLVVPFGADELRPTYRGTTLAPWPNRVVDGRYDFRGASLQLPLTEPLRWHALHGLASWLDFEVTRSEVDRVDLAATIEPQAGYPWRIAVETTYAVDDRGLTQVIRATNASHEAAPWGTGPHPYLVAGAGPLDEWVLELPAAQVLEVTEPRLVPTALEAVDARDPERFDFRTPRPIGAVEIDHAYTDLTRSDDGIAMVRVTEASGQGAAIAWDSACAWVQIHTADLPGGPGQAGHRAGLAVEPMTCAPDAFNDDAYEHHTGLAVLEPGASARASWTISAIESEFPQPG